LEYNALPSQKKFLELRTRFKGFSGPVGSGKSSALCFEAIRLAYQNPGRTGLIGAPTYNMLGDVTIRAFLEHCSSLGVSFSISRSRRTITLAESRATILFRSVDSPERLRGTNLAWFGLDELTYCSEEAWLRLEARLRDPRAIRLTGFGVWTPKGFDWVHSKFVAERAESYGLIRAAPYENRHLLETTPDYYENLEASYDKHFFEQEALGLYIHLGAGRVYGGFSREANLGATRLDPDLPILASWDFNVNPMTVLIAQSAGDSIHVLDEIILPSSSTEESLREFTERYGRHKAGMRIYGDASGRQRRTSSQFSDLELIRRHAAACPSWRAEVLFGTKNPPVRDRINLVNGCIRDAAGKVRLVIDERCSALVDDLEQTVYKAGSSVVDKSDSRRTHATDALGYLLWGENVLKRPVGEQPGRLF